MIVPDAKCVVNGGKLNALISAVNPLLSAVRETLDVVDGGNKPGQRRFLIASIDDAPNPSDRQQLTTEGDEGGVVGGAGNQRDKLDAAAGGAGNAGIKVAGGGAAGGAGGINVTGGAGALKDDGSRPANQGGGVDQFGNTTGGSGALFDDGSRPANQGGGVDQFGNTTGGSGALFDDGSRPANQTGQQPSGALFDDGSRPANQTTLPPLPGAEPPNQQQDQETRDDARKQREAYGVDPREVEKGRRKLESFRKKKQQNSTETFLQDLATKKRQAQADRMASANRMGGKYSPYSRGRR